VSPEPAFRTDCDRAMESTSFMAKKPSSLKPKDYVLAALCERPRRWRSAVWVHSRLALAPYNKNYLLQSVIDILADLAGDPTKVAEKGTQGKELYLCKCP
jgi:hypothetical protein